MKFVLVVATLCVGSCTAFRPGVWSPPPHRRQQQRATSLTAEIRGPSDKSETLRYGWDGKTALGGAVEVAKPARMLEDIRAAGETVPEECEVRLGVFCFCVACASVCVCVSTAPWLTSLLLM